ncbi:MAG: hypothetical protein LAP61_23640 [Acidobacteriia bacterium]|nr:hypothetical protein [Terriglobia bacterium]
MDISRRQLAGVILAGTVVGQSAAQAPAQAPPPSADAQLEGARSERRIAAQIIARVPLPMTVEPAFQFKA